MICYLWALKQFVWASRLHSTPEKPLPLSYQSGWEQVLSKSKAGELGFPNWLSKETLGPEQKKGGRQRLEEERGEGREWPQKLRAGPDREEQVE